MLVPALVADFPTYDFGTQRTYSGVCLVAMRRDGAARPGVYAVVTSDPAEMRQVLEGEGPPPRPDNAAPGAERGQAGTPRLEPPAPGPAR
jgi:hypothetical protein